MEDPYEYQGYKNNNLEGFFCDQYHAAADKRLLLGLQKLSILIPCPNKVRNGAWKRMQLGVGLVQLKLWHDGGHNYYSS